MYPLPFLAAGRPVAAADQLITAFGPDAAGEAAARADRSRTVGNHIHFCHWREVERLIGVMGEDRAVGLLH